jgi:hypothetical protein
MAAIGVPIAGMPFVHDPSTVVRFHGKYYVYSTGRGIPFYSSPDGVTWTREGSVFTQIPDDVHAAVPKNNGMDVWAPDILRVNGQFYLYYAVSSWGSFQSAIALATNPVLDPKDPAYKWTDRGVVVTSNGTEDLNAIDPGAILAPTTAASASPSSTPPPAWRCTPTSLARPSRLPASPRPPTSSSTAASTTSSSTTAAAARVRTASTTSA